DFDLQMLLRAVTDAVAAKQGWSVKTEVYLGLFSFQKLVMYKDLEANSESLQRHRLIQQLVTRAAADDTHVVGLPADLRQLELAWVHDRLVRAKRGEFCRELHSTKASKRTVMKELGAALDASLQTVAAPTASTQRLPHVRATLSEYAKAVHEPYGTLGASPF